ncbi:MAG: hypothetical protein ACQESR_25980 [Planctomycetota bacterium]
MNVRLLLPAMLMLLLTGCRKDPYMQVYIENMNAEKRLLEDTLYDLQYDYETKVAEVERLREELEELNSGGPGAAGSTGSDDGAADREPRDLFPAIPDLKPPSVDEGGPNGENSRRGDGGTGRQENGAAEREAEIEDPVPPKLELDDSSASSREGRRLNQMPEDQTVTHLRVAPIQVSGPKGDEQAGEEQPSDEGMTLVLEPQNRRNQVVPLAGRVAVTAVVPESGRRVGQWEFSEAETEMAWSKGRAGQGITLKMPWRSSPPTRNRLKLAVRYWRPDGKIIEANRDVTVSGRGQLAARWTPRTEPPPDPATRPQVNVAEGPGRDGDATPRGDRERRNHGESSNRLGAAPPSTREAHLPEWRPYR